MWRGLLVDSGRRFAPVPLLKTIIETMAAVKLNVLHLHLSDYCRFGVESKRYPNLTAALTGANAGHYTHADVNDIVAYAGDRGVRVIPEFDVPSHSLGFLPVASPGGLEFCSTCAYAPTGCVPSQLYGTPGTAKVLKDVFEEMAGLFTDTVFHVGGDETFVKAGKGERCTPNSTAYLEKQVVDAVANDYGKTPAGWEQVLFETGAATEDTILYAYVSPPANVTATGHRAVAANGSALYLTAPAPGGTSISNPYTAPPPPFFFKKWRKIWI